MLKNNYTHAQFLTLRSPNFFNFEPAVQPLSFCELDPRINVYLRFSPQFLQETPWNLVFIADKPLELVFGLEYAF